jgi:Txe/YoeB family toxin of Txe-Axe toxin-antitoxin module
VKWRIVFTKQAQKDAKKLTAAGLRSKAERLLDILRDLAGAYSRRINIQHRLVYEILNKEKVIKVIRMWTHYE